MRTIILLAVVCVALASCDTPKTITANPDNQAATSGTVGSAKMTTKMPTKSDTSVIQRDSIRRNR